MGNGRSILVIERDTQLRNTLCEAFEFEGYNTDSASDWNDLLQIGMKKARPDLIFWDTKMPLRNAKLFVDLLKHDETYSRIPTVLISGEADRPDIGKDLSVIPKCFDLDLVLSLASQFCTVPAT